VVGGPKGGGLGSVGTVVAGVVEASSRLSMLVKWTELAAVIEVLGGVSCPNVLRLAGAPRSLGRLLPALLWTVLWRHA